MTKKIHNVRSVVPLLKSIANMKQEHVVVITLDSNMRTIKKRTVFIGTVSASLIHPREIFAGAIEDRASAIIMAHNHPSGDVTPSKEDRDITEIIESAGNLMGIEMIDSVIVAGSDYYSVICDEGVEDYKES